MNCTFNAVAFVLTAVVGPLLGNPVGRDQRAVQNRVSHLPDTSHRGVQVVGRRAVQGLTPPGRSARRWHADLEASRESGVGAAVAQMSQSEQRLPAGVEASPPGPTLLAVGSDAVGEVVQGAAGQGTAAG